MTPSKNSPEQLLQQIAKELYNNNVELNKERKRVQEVLFQVAEVIFSVDQNYKITIFNSSAENTFNVSKENAIGQNADNIIKLHDRDKKKEISIKNYAFKNKDQIPNYINEPIAITSENGETSYHKLNYNNIIINSHIKECVVSLSNITDEVELDNQKDEFISIASHELKTPVTIIKTNLWMFEHTLDTKINSNQRHLLNETEEGVKRLSRIVSNLLDISRLEQGKLAMDISKVNVDKVIKEIIDEFEEVASKKGLKLQYKENNVGTIETDRDRFIEVLNNLLGNSIKYTKSGHVKVSVSNLSDSIKITVIDTGPGIAKKEHQRLFKKFSRASEGLRQQVLGASTGLGLYISKRIIEEMGGEIGFKSEIGKGSVFWFTIPKSAKI